MKPCYSWLGSFGAPVASSSSDEQGMPWEIMEINTNLWTYSRALFERSRNTSEGSSAHTRHTDGELHGTTIYGHICSNPKFPPISQKNSTSSDTHPYVFFLFSILTANHAPPPMKWRSRRRPDTSVPRFPISAGQIGNHSRSPSRESARQRQRPFFFVLKIKSRCVSLRRSLLSGSRPKKSGQMRRIRKPQ